MRSALWASAVYNLGGTLLFVFPSSLGRLAGLPAPVARVYTALLAVFVALFGGAYAWLARQPRIDRPLVAMAASGRSMRGWRASQAYAPPKRATKTAKSAV